MSQEKEKIYGNKDGVKARSKELFDILTSESVNMRWLISILYSKELAVLSTDTDRKKKLNTLTVAFYKMVYNHRDISDDFLLKILDVLKSEAKDVLEKVEAIRKPLARQRKISSLTKSLTDEEVRYLEDLRRKKG